MSKVPKKAVIILRFGEAKLPQFSEITMIHNVEYLFNTYKITQRANSSTIRIKTLLDINLFV